MSNHACPDEPYQLENLCEECLKLVPNNPRTFTFSEDSGIIILYGDGSNEYILPTAKNQEIFERMRQIAFLLGRAEENQ